MVPKVKLETRVRQEEKVAQLVKSNKRQLELEAVVDKRHLACPSHSISSRSS